MYYYSMLAEKLCKCIFPSPQFSLISETSGRFRLSVNGDGYKKENWLQAVFLSRRKQFRSKTQTLTFIGLADDLLRRDLHLSHYTVCLGSWSLWSFLKRGTWVMPRFKPVTCWSLVQCLNLCTTTCPINKHQQLQGLGDVTWQFDWQQGCI